MQAQKTGYEFKNFTGQNYQRSKKDRKTYEGQSISTMSPIPTTFGKCLVSLQSKGYIG